ncbi:MAG: transglycosylase SLT domain-containing protein, partial [Calditrichaeota bacterium]|nr:transglycosylase SLT domain-containing protein [Calditrichota bacterium]
MKRIIDIIIIIACIVFFVVFILDFSPMEIYRTLVPDSISQTDSLADIGAEVDSLQITEGDPNIKSDDAGNKSTKAGKKTSVKDKTPTDNVTIKPSRSAVKKKTKKRNYPKKRLNEVKMPTTTLRDIDLVVDHETVQKQIQDLQLLIAEEALNHIDELQVKRESLELRLMNFSFQPVGNLDISVKLPEHNKYDELIKYYSKKYNVDPLHLKTIIAVESNYNPKARNPKSSATGLTQIVSGTYK